MTRGPGSCRTVVLALTLALAAPHTAVAQTDPAGAEALFRQGMDLKKAGKFTEACPKLEESYKLDPQGGTLFMLADCLEHEGRVASAWARFQEAADFARRSNKKDKEEESKKRMAALEGRLPKISIVVPAGVSGLEGLEIRRDGLPVGKATWGTPLPVDPGKHVVEVTAKGKKKWKGEVEVPKGAGVSNVTVPELADEAAPPPPATTTAPTPSSTGAPPPASTGVSATPQTEGWGTQHYVGLGLAGVGVGVAALGLFVFEKKSNSLVDDAGPHCPPVRPEGCDAEGSQLYKDARSKHNTAVLAWGVGGAAVVGGAVVFLLAPRKQGTGASVYLAPQVGGATVGGRF